MKEQVCDDLAGFGEWANEDQMMMPKQRTPRIAHGRILFACTSPGVGKMAEGRRRLIGLRVCVLLICLTNMPLDRLMIDVAYPFFFVNSRVRAAH